MFKVTAPLRIDLAGGMTDLPVFSSEVGTCIVNLGIDLYSDLQKTIPRQLVLSVTPKSPDVPNPTTTALMRVFISLHPVLKNYNFQVSDCLPTGTGLGGSSRLSVSLSAAAEKIAAIEKGINYSIDPSHIVCEAHHFEVKEMGIKGGFQDFISACFGKLNFINFNSPHIANLTGNPYLGMQPEPEIKEYLNSHMVILLLSEEKHTSSGLVAEDEIKRYKKDPHKIRPLLLGIKKCNQDMFKLLTSPGKLPDRLINIGRIMTESTKLQKQLSPLVCKSPLSDWQKRAEPFVYGIRAPGAGANSLFLLVKPDMMGPLLSEFSSEDMEILFASINETGVKLALQGEALRG